MKSYIAYKNQIQGIKDVSETVKTVEKVAASSVHFLKKEVDSLNVYASEVDKILTRLSIFYQKNNHPLLQKKYVGKKTLIILTGDKGLVGGLWHDVVGRFLGNTSQYQTVVVVGLKGENYLKEENTIAVKSFVNIFSTPSKEDTKHITDYIFTEFKKGTFSQVDVLYPKFISLAEQVPTISSFIPFDFKLTEDNKRNIVDGLPIFESSKQQIFDRLLEKYIEIFFHKIIMETKLSELSARTVEMEHASTKTVEFIQKLTLNYTKHRRRVITQRQLESFNAHKII